ncbi:MAG: DedA family protein, partial [Actinobacteria bacterium]|nr:DedA family protein [Actinomycetota bacterium]
MRTDTRGWMVSLLQGLDGALAGVILCVFLFAEEAGVPMPIGGEVAVIAGGGLVGTGALDPWLFVPLAMVSCIGGALTGYSWTRLVGQHGLRAAAERLHQGARLAKITARFQRAGPGAIALSRVTPGMRVYTSLLAGAAAIDRRRFLVVVGPITVVWVGVFTALGAVVGGPVSQFLSQIQNLVLHGGVLIVIGAGAYIGVRRIPEGGRAPLSRLPDEVRVVLAVAVDIAMIATVVAGVV